jgi:hypothetical protein
LAKHINLQNQKGEWTQNWITPPLQKKEKLVTCPLKSKKKVWK